MATTITTAPVPAPPKKELPTLLPLEDDDEFEEFKAEGKSSNSQIVNQSGRLTGAGLISDWDAKDSYGASLAKTGAPGKTGLDSLWEDNWDDDDVADDFSAQLRGELLKQEQMQA